MAKVERMEHEFKPKPTSGKIFTSNSSTYMVIGKWIGPSKADGNNWFVTNLSTGHVEQVSESVLTHFEGKVILSND